MKTWHVVPLIAVALLFSAPMAGAQTPRVAPSTGFIFLDEKAVDRFVVQRWVSAASPEVSPAGFCECMTVVYEGTRRLFTPALDGGTTSVSVVGDVTGDRLAELVFRSYSGGAHCCESTAIYSIERAGPRSLLSINTDACLGELVDLDKNGASEFRACDPMFGYAFCSFAFTPFPPVVFSYDRQKGEFVLSTPRYARYLQLQSENEARSLMKEYPNEAEVSRCAALGPALGLIYTGRVARGQALFRKLYTGPDAMAVERKALEMARSSPLWIAR
jgi:hypothetical protein